MAMYGRPAGDETDSDEELIFYPSATNHSQPKKHSSEAKKFSVAKKLAKEEVNPIPPSYSSEKLEELRVAIMKGNLNKVKDIIETTVSVDTLMKGGWTPLLYACSCSQCDIIHFLIDKGANPNVDRDMYTPLMALCAGRKEDGLLECCEKMIKHGAVVNASEKHHVTPLMFASRGGFKELVKLLINNNADVNAQDNRGWPALAWAANQGCGEVVKILLENKADPCLVTINGETLPELAKAQGYTLIAEALENATDSEVNPALLDKLPLREKKEINESKSLDPSSTTKFRRYGDLEVFLSGLGLSHLLPIFEEQKINFQMFLSLTDEELEKLGVTKLGERKTILSSLVNVHQKKWEESSIISFRNKNYISCPDILAILENIAKHILYIQSTIKYLQNKVEANEYGLEVGKDVVQVSNLSQQARIAIENAYHLQDTLKGFALQLEKEERRIEHRPADLIVNKPVKRKPPISYYAITAGLIFLAVILVKPSRIMNAFRNLW